MRRVSKGSRQQNRFRDTGIQSIMKHRPVSCFYCCLFSDGGGSMNDWFTCKETAKVSRISSSWLSFGRVIKRRKQGNGQTDDQTNAKILPQMNAK